MGDVLIAPKKLAAARLTATETTALEQQAERFLRLLPELGLR